jgi:hypothetical protein
MNRDVQQTIPEENERRRMALANQGATPTVVKCTRSLKLPTFSGGLEKDDLSPLNFVEQIETYCKATKRDINDECTEMYLALRGNTMFWWKMLKRRGTNTRLV